MTCKHLDDRTCRLGLCGGVPALSCCERCESYEGPKRGLGDFVQMVTRATGIEKVVHAIAGKDCGCGKRRTALNRIMPFGSSEPER